MVVKRIERITSIIVLAMILLVGCRSSSFKRPFADKHSTSVVSIPPKPASPSKSDGDDTNIGEQDLALQNATVETSDLGVVQTSFIRPAEMTFQEEMDSDVAANLNEIEIGDDEPQERNDVVSDDQDAIEQDSAGTKLAASAVKPNEVTGNAKMYLQDVLDSVANHFPLIEVAIGELDSAEGKQFSQFGQFDTRLEGYSISQPVGFYKTYQNGVSISKPLYQGGSVYGAYRIGDGQFEPWYGERETNEGGEFKVGFDMPLIKDRRTDQRRTAVQVATAQRDQVAFNIDGRLIAIEREATAAYWNWVASGLIVRAEEEILELAKSRVDQIRNRVELGALPKVAEIDNQRFIAKRENDLFKAQRKLQSAAIKLSLYLRDTDGEPIRPGIDWIPMDFPKSETIDEQSIEQCYQTALSNRPDFQELDAMRREACAELAYAENLTLWKLNAKGFAGQDLGAPASAKGDKSPFELQAGLYAEVPVQRREGQGKILAAQGKLVQIEAKQRFVANKIEIEIRDAASALNVAYDRIETSRKNLELTLQALDLGRVAFEAGKIDLIELNIYETSVFDARQQLVEAEFEYFTALVIFETASQAKADFVVR
ncbi:MAG: TolC family protein [Pirellulaceae bacterium]